MRKLYIKKIFTRYKKILERLNKKYLGKILSKKTIQQKSNK